jgi:hypothetical protein
LHEKKIGYKLNSIWNAKWYTSYFLEMKS